MITLIIILLFVNGTFEIMNNQLTTSFFSSDIFSAIVNWFTLLTSKVETSLSTTDNLHLLAVVLVALIVVTAFFAVLFIFMRIFSFIFFRKKTKRHSSLSSKAKEDQSSDEMPDDETEEENVSSEQFLEDELQEELAQSDSNQNSASEDSSKEELEEKENNTFPQEIKTDNYEPHYRTQEKQLIELDWKKKPKSQDAQSTSQEHSTQQGFLNVRKNLHDLVGMIVNMIGRNIDELKIAQALMYRCKEEVSEETVLQIVHSIKEFLVLCNQGAFDNVRRRKDLPTDEDCILHLITGDTSYAMALMEALMDDRINQAVSMKNMVQREALFRQSSDYACYFGTLAEINDINLASASFELAIEMYPENPLAWSRSADIYKKLGMEDKANWAYRNVLKLIKQGEDRSQEANARKYLSQYMYAQGEGNQASQLYMQSKTYYDSIGINRPLDRKELEIIELIDQTENEKILESILSRQQNILTN